MRLNGLALVASAIVLAACGGSGDNNNTDSANAAQAGGAATTPAPTTDTGAAAQTPGASGAAGSSAATITGTTHDVRMVGDDKGYRFEPAAITVKAGDGIRYLFVNGGPHNVAFDPAQVPADVKAQLDANIQGEKAGELASRMLMNPNEAVVVSFANIKPGSYTAICQPHAAMNMIQKITVQ